MFKKHLKLMIITSIVILLPILIGLLLWQDLPNEIPIHWNMQGEIDGYAPKAFAVMVAPLFLVLTQWFAMFVTLSDPKRKNHSDKILVYTFWIIPILSTTMNALLYLTALSFEVAVEVFVPVFVGIILIIAGNYLPKCRQNYTLGIKLPWTLNSEENWNRTHRLAGILWVIGGIIFTIASLLKLMPLAFVVILLMVLIPTIYSYLLYKKGI